VPELVGLRRAGRVLVVELEEGYLTVADLEEAHDLAEVVAVPVIDRTALDRGVDPLSHDGRLEVGRGARLRQLQIGRIAEGEDIGSSTHLKGRPVGGQSAARGWGQA